MQCLNIQYLHIMDFLLPYCFFFLVLLLLPFSSNGQAHSNISLGLSLTASLESSYLAMAFPILHLSFSLLIMLPPFAVSQTGGSKAELTANRGISLTDPQGRELWRSETIIGVVLDRGMTLSSRQSETNFSKGRFQLKLRDDGNLVLATINLPGDYTNEPYYKSGTDGGLNSSSPGNQVVFNESGYLYILRENAQIFSLTQRVTASTGDFYHRATLNFDAVFTQYYHPKASTGNERLNSDRRPICECPGGYSLLDPSDQYGSCRPNYTQSCEEDEVAPVEDLSGNTCWKKKLPLSNGRVQTNLDGKALLKVRRSNVNPRSPYFPNNKKDRDGLILVGSVFLGCSVFVNFLLVCAICMGLFFIYRRRTKRIPQKDGAVETNLRCFTYQELAEATEGFKEELGRGAFGVVYKGVVHIGSSIVVAVKKLNNMAEDRVREFKTEVNVIGQTHHKNLVRLLGFCEEGDQRLLVYEFMSNGSLSSFIFQDAKPGWKERIQIAFGVARGLLYLHEECSNQIIHCDIKPQNILLDEYYNARISDFGLAKLLLLDQSQTHTAIRGTKGYVAPEWFRNLPVTVKVDVYSYGVLLLEIICCRRNVDSKATIEEQAILTDWAYDCYREGTLDALVGSDTGALDGIEKLERFLMIAFWCIQEDPSLRPTMRKVTQMLEGVVEVPVPPCPCLLYAAS
ncbi:hypothetical protein POTOM_014672 [Populus tomentosa]|uniref:non-specific serine/threonine protein kinase n=1 Tax=Populus tomentosa TaxID=118781 RepID=A0A8X8DAA5_POPTO|nr:hypothetical protein POTOM_014672 [Populus tomentosa]